jgi:predicted nucleic acid-binding protein
LVLVVDASLPVKIEREGQVLARAMQAARTTNLCVSMITAAELLAGIHRAQPRPVCARREAFLEFALGAMPLLEFDLISARVLGSVLADPTGRGERIGAYDAIIAATALAHGFGVLTDNVKAFRRVRGLEVVPPDWTL